MIPSNDLFPDDSRPVPDPCTGGILQPCKHLPDTAEPYNLGKLARCADPIGLSGLPARRAGLDRLLLELCNRLAAAGGVMVSAARLVDELLLNDDRTLRLLLAYGRVHHRIRDLVGIEGGGYCWGGLNPDAYRQAAAVARRKGLCSLFLSGLYSSIPPIVQVAQLCLDFRTPSRDGDGDNDELNAWMRAEGVNPAAICEAFVETFAATEAGREALQRAAAKRPGIFVDKATIDRLRRQVSDASDTLQLLGDAK